MSPVTWHPGYGLHAPHKARTDLPPSIQRFKFGHGRVFWAYVVLYTLARVRIEMTRIDGTGILQGLRLDVWVRVPVSATTEPAPGTTLRA
ncbi:hypothetical protein GCM10028784_23730 [Myceligenerans cantabricum]